MYHIGVCGFFALSENDCLGVYSRKMIAYVLCVCSVMHDGSDLIYYVALTPLSLECECEFGICLSIGDTVDIIDQSYTMPHTWVKRYRHELLPHLALPLSSLCATCM